MLCPYGKLQVEGDGEGVRLKKRRIISAAGSLCLIVTVAIVCRVRYAYVQVREIPPRALASVPFESETGNIAMALATGKGYSSPMRSDTGATGWLAAGAPAVVGGVFFVFGGFPLPAFYSGAAWEIIFL